MTVARRMDADDFDMLWIGRDNSFMPREALLPKSLRLETGLKGIITF